MVNPGNRDELTSPEGRNGAKGRKQDLGHAWTWKERGRGSEARQALEAVQGPQPAAVTATRHLTWVLTWSGLKQVLHSHLATHRVLDPSPERLIHWPGVEPRHPYFLKHEARVENYKLKKSISWHRRKRHDHSLVYVTVVPWYPGEIVPSTSTDTKSQGCSSPLY